MRMSVLSILVERQLVAAPNEPAVCYAIKTSVHRPIPGHLVFTHMV